MTENDCSRVVRRPQELLTDSRLQAGHVSDQSCPSGGVVGFACPEQSKGNAEMIEEYQVLTRLHGGTGSEADWKWIYEQHKKLAIRIAERIVGNEADALDACQETWLRVYRSISSFETDRPFMPWLLTITKNAAITLLKKRKQAAKSYDIDELKFKESLALAIACNARQEAGELLAEPLSALAGEDQVIVWLLHVDNMSYEEIAVLLEIPEGTVKSKCGRAMAHLREALGVSLQAIRHPRTKGKKR